MSHLRHLCVYLVVCTQAFAPPTVCSNAFLLQWPSQIGPEVGVFAFTLSVTEEATTEAPFETGLVWRENTTVRGTAACCGNSSWALSAATTYQWSVHEFQGQVAAPVGLPLRGSFKTCGSLLSPRQEAQQLTFAPAASKVFNDTATSLLKRTQTNGFFGESPYSGQYGNVEFTRTIGAAVAAFLEMGEDAFALRVLRFILELHKEQNAPFPSHIVRPPSLPGRNYTLEMIEQTDGSFHLIVAWARVCNLHPGNTKLFTDFYGMMRVVLVFGVGMYKP